MNCVQNKTNAFLPADEGYFGTRAYLYRAASVISGEKRQKRTIHKYGTRDEGISYRTGNGGDGSRKGVR